MPVLLELFSGTGSIGRAFRDIGWDVVSVDNDPRANATFCCDVNRWVIPEDLLEEGVSAIWASPPCTMYSNARSRGTHPRDLEGADELVRKTLEIAAALGNHTPLFIENPFTGRLKMRGLLDHLNLRVVDYCSYGTPYRKRTAVWTNTEWVPARPPCGHQKHLATAQQGPPGPRFEQSELYRIPAELCDEIARYVSSLATGDATMG